MSKRYQAIFDSVNGTKVEVYRIYFNTCTLKSVTILILFYFDNDSCMVVRICGLTRCGKLFGRVRRLVYLQISYIQKYMFVRITSC